MPSTMEILSRLSRPAGRARDLLPDDDLRAKLQGRRGKSAWEAVLDYLDLPGLTVRSLLKGDIGGTARSVGSFVLPGIIDQPEDRKDFGFVGNLLTDPLLWFTGGGAGLKGALAGATKGLAGKYATKAAARALRGSLTKAGRAEFGNVAKGLVTNVARPGGASRAFEAATLKAARKLPSVADDLLKRGLADKGGLKFGAPFTEGRTIAFAGKPANLAMASPYYWAAKGATKALKSTETGYKVARYFEKGWRDLGSKLYFGKHFNEESKILGSERNASIRRLTKEGRDEVVETFKGFDPDALQDFTQTLAGKDLRKTGVVDRATFLAKHPKLDYDSVLTRYKAMMDKVRKDLVDRGIWMPEEEWLEQAARKELGIHGDDLAPYGGPKAQAMIDAVKDRMRREGKNYFPQQWTDEATEAFEKANWEAELKNVEGGFPTPRGTGAKGANVRNVFMKERKFTEQDDFLKHVEDLVSQAGGKVKNFQELDIATLAMKRLSAHARTVSNFDMLREATKRYGPAIGKRDLAFSEWLKAGAGRIDRRKGLMVGVDWWNKRLFKPLVTVGAGPIPNPPFLIRNAISGVLQAAAHPKIGLESGLRHIAQIAYDGMAALVEKIPGMGKLPRSQLTRIIEGNVTDTVVKGTSYTERQIAELMKKHGVKQSFVRMEDLLRELEPVRAAKGVARKAYDAVVGSQFPAKLSDGIESRMRAQGFVHALKKGLAPEDAAKAVREAFIDYETVSNLHRNIRDIIPFAQFTIGQTPRTIRTALERPRVFSPLVAGSRREEGGILPPYVAEQPHFNLGKDTEGKSAFLAGLGTPFEDINSLWAGSLGRTFERGIGMTSPPIKAVYEQASGRDPFFGRPISDYRRETPTTSLLPDVLAGRTVRTTKEGQKIPEVSPQLHRVIQKLPWSRQISMANQLFDSRKRTWHKAISLLTGAKVVSVDQDRELRRVILEYLKDRAEAGEIGEFARFFAYGETSPELAALVKQAYSGGAK